MALETENVLAGSFQQLGQTADASVQNAAETSDAVNSNDLDYTDADHPLSDLSGFNVNTITKNNVTTQGLEDFKTTYADSGVTTDNTTTPPKNLSIADLDNLGKKQIIDQKNQAKIAGAQFEATSRNPYMSFKAYEFDQYTSKVDRYRGYGATTFNKLGFNPMEDNEEYYNANTTNWQDFKRMSGQYGTLFGTAFMSNYKTFKDWIGGTESLIDPDEELDDQMARANELGMSSKKGGWAFTTNLALQTAYTVGILANIAAEEAVIALGAAALAATGGGGPAAAALEGAEQIRTADKLRKLYQGWKAGMVGVKSVGQMFKGGYQMVKSLRYANDAREFWTAARAGGAMFGRGALHFINPLEGTTDVVRGIRAGEMGYKNLTNMAKASRTFGAFYRDVRNGWFSIGESKMEGGGVYNDVVRDEIKIYQESHNGEFPPQDELDKIYQRAEDAGTLNTTINIPMIFLSNKMVLDNIFSFRGAGSIMNATEEFGIKGAGKNFVWNLGERTFTENSLGYLKNLSKAALNPKTYIAGSLNYFKANLMEGVQELGQETSSGAIKEYYHNTYLDPSLGGSDYTKSMVYSSLGKNVFSKQGLETFASGFLMGGMTSAGGKVLKSGLTGASELFMKKFSPEKYDAYVKNKKQAETVVLNAMNSIMADPAKFFSRTKESAVNQKKVSQNLSEASINNDDYAFYNAKDEQAFDHVFTTLDAGSFGQMVGALKSFNKLSDKELADAFNVEDGTKAREKLDEYIGRAGQIKEKYDYFQKKFPNPFDPKRFEKGSEEQIREFIAYKGFEDAKKAAVASQYGFERATQRMTGVFSELQKNPAIRKSSATDYTVLQSSENIVNEIKILQDEIAGLKTGGVEEKKLARKKQKKLDTLEEYLGNLDIYETEKEKSTVTADGKLVSPSNKKLLSPLSKSFKKYIKALAELNGEEYVFDDNIKSAFDKMSDYYKLSDDAKSYTNVVNKLINPEELVRYAQVIDQSLMEIYNDRNNYLTESVKNYVSIFELNELMVALGKMGVIISPDQVDDMVKKGEMPTVFFDLFKNVIIDEKDPRYLDVIEKVQIYTKLKGEDGVGKEEVKPAEATPVQPTAATVTPTTPYGTPSGPELVTQTPAGQTAMPADLQTLLKAAYDEYMQNNPQSSMTFSDYANTSARAAGIKKDYEEKNKGKQQPAPVSTDAKAGIERRRQDARNNPVNEPENYKEAVDEYKATELGSSEDAKIKKDRLIKEAETKEGKNFVENQVAQLEYNDDGTITVYRSGTMQKGHNAVTTSKKTAEIIANERKKQGLSSDIIEVRVNPSDISVVVPGIESEVFIKVDDTNKERIDKNTKKEQKTKDQLLLEKKGVENELEKTKNALTNAKKDKVDGTFKFSDNVYNDVVKNQEAKIKNLEWQLKKYDAELAALESKSTTSTQTQTPTPVAQSLVNPKVVITGTRRGMENLSTNNWDGKEVTDVRRRFQEFEKNTFVEDKDGKGNKIINYMVNAKDAFGRAGFLQISLKVSESTVVDNTMLKNLFDNQVTLLANKYNLDKGYIDLTNITNDDFNKMKDAIVYGLENMAIKSEVTEIQLAAETNLVEPVEQVKTAKETAKEILDSATSLRGFPNPKLEGKSKVAQDLIALLSDVDADISPKDVAEMYQVRKKELKENIQLSDFQKGDLVTFTNGKKGFVNKVEKDGVIFKMIDSGPGEFQKVLTMGNDNLMTTVDMIEEKKAVPVEQTEKVEIDKADKKEVEISKNTLAEFSSDPAKIKAAMEETKSQTSTSNQNNTNNLLNNLGCKTKI